MAIQKLLTLFCQFSGRNCVQPKAVIQYWYADPWKLYGCGIFQFFITGWCGGDPEHSTLFIHSYRIFWDGALAPCWAHVWISALCPLLPIKRVSQISVLPCCKLKMAQQCSQQNSKSHWEQGQDHQFADTSCKQFCQLSDTGFISVTAGGGGLGTVWRSS